MNVELAGDLPSAFWDDLRARVRPEQRLFASATWWEAWAAAHLSDAGTWRRPLRYLVARDETGTAMGVLPLASLRVAKQTLAAVAGFYQPYRTLPLSAADARDTGAAIADALHDARGVPALRIAGAEEPDQALIALLLGLRERGWAVYEETKGYVYCVPLPPTREQFEAELSKSVLENVKRYDKKMRKTFTVEERVYHAVDADQWRRAVTDLGSIETRSWLAKDAHGDLRFAGEANTKFWTTLLADDEYSRAARAFVLYFDGKPVSFLFALDSGGTRFVLANQYDEEVSSYNTGVILYHRVFADAFEQGVTLMHLGGGDSGYKSRWGATATRVLRDWVVCRPSLRGRALYAALSMRTMASALRPKRLVGS